MIDLIKEKHYSNKDNRFKPQKDSIYFDSSKPPMFTCFVYAERKIENFNIKDQSKLMLPKINKRELIVNDKNQNIERYIYLGTNNGSIFSINLKYLKSHNNQNQNEINIITNSDTFKHKGQINILLWEIIDNTSILFSGGVDGNIKIWKGVLENYSKVENNYIKTLFGHKGSILSMVYCKSKSIIISSSTDQTMKIWKLNDNFDIIINPFFECIQTFRKFGDFPKIGIQYWITSLSLKDLDSINLYASDSEGNIHIYDYENYNNIDKEYFSYNKSIPIHRLSTKRVLHSPYDNTIYSIGFDNKLLAYNLKERKTIMDILNNKTFFTEIKIYTPKQEIICCDDKGYISFIKIFNHSINKIKYSKIRLEDIILIDSIPNKEYIIILSNEFIDIVKIKREIKIVNIQLHNDDIIKLIAINPVKNSNNEILEDTKIISTGKNGVIKYWDYFTMELINKINPPLINDNSFSNSYKLIITCMNYIFPANIICLGTENGDTLFWNCNCSNYIKISNANNKKQGYISSINVNLTKTNKLYCFISSLDGSIFIWELEKEELKIKKSNIDEINDKPVDIKLLNRQDIDKFTAKEFNELLILYNINENNNHHSDNKKCEMKTTSFNYTPTLKFTLNTNNIIEECKLNFNKNEINCCNYSTQNNYLYTGAKNGLLHVWNFYLSTYISTIYDHNSEITNIIIDRHLLISSDKSGIILISSIDLNSVLYKLINQNIQNPCIIDMIMIPSYGILVSINSYKNIDIWRYEKKELLISISVKVELTCMQYVEFYGKLIFGTSNFTLYEEDLKGIFDNLKIKNEFMKYPFLNNPKNYLPNQKQFDNNKIMKSINSDYII